MKALFLDTHYLLALINPDDEWHGKAVAASGTVAKCAITEAILVEVADALGRSSDRARAVRIIEELRADPRVECIPVDRGLFQRGFDLYRSRPDKDWSLTDCISFVVMGERKLEAALTGDRHFEQAGFRALLREEGNARR
jgi:predicted nucleic acid-binding protein